MSAETETLHTYEVELSTTAWTWVTVEASNEQEAVEYARDVIRGHPMDVEYDQWSVDSVKIEDAR